MTILTKKITTAAMLVIATTGLAKATTQSDLIAYQIGKQQLPNTNSAAAFLKQGQLAMATTTANQAKQVYVLGATMPACQSSTFQSQYYNGTMATLTSPVTTNIVSTVVNLANGETTKVSGNLNPTLTTPAAVLTIAVKALPNYAPGWVSNAVAQSLTTNWGSAKLTTAQRTSNASKAASTALVAAAKLYPKGTVNATAATFPTTQQGVANAASAVTANSFNGLIANSQLNTNNVQAVAVSLTSAAVAIQKSSTGGFPNGALGAEGLATTTQLSGGYLNLADNIGNTSTLLSAMITGAGKSLGKNQGNITAFTYGLSQGLIANYLYTANIAGGDATTAGATSYKNANTATIVNYVLQATGLLSNSTYQTSLTTTVNTAINGLAGAYTNFKNGTPAATAYSLIDGAKGINYFALLNGQGTALTDTSGL
jgi:hypothetical protein